METSDSDQHLEAVAETLYARGVSDGLPVVPPTTERIDEMLRGTDLPRAHQLAEFGNGVLTVEDLAAYAVLAGCSPLQFPLVVAGVDAMADKDSVIGETADDSGSFAFQWIVNGPIREQADVRSDTGAFGPGFRTNRTVGRALGLAYQNTAEVDIRDETDGGVGNPFKYTMVAGENEEASPWEPYHVSQGFAPTDDTITFAARRSFVQFIPADMSVDGLVQAMEQNLSPDMLGRTMEGRAQHAVFTLAPYNAEGIAEAGMSKADLRTFLADNSVRPFEEIGPLIEDDLELDAPWFDSTSPMQIAQIESPERVDVFVVGGSGRFNAVGRTHGSPITTEIPLPDAWDRLREEYTVDRDWGRITKQYDETDG